MAIWAQNRYIIGFLVLVILGHWSLILQGIIESLPWPPVPWFPYYKASSWRPSGYPEQDALLLKPTTRFLLPFSFTLCASTLLSSCWTHTNSLELGEKGRECLAPAGSPNSSSQMAWFTSCSRESPLLTLLYFSVLTLGSRFVVNLLATIFMSLNLNQIMSVIFNVPAAIFSTVSGIFLSELDLKWTKLQIVACRAVRRLTSFTHNGADI